MARIRLAFPATYTGPLTVSEGGAAITGDSTVTGALAVSGATTSVGVVTVPAGAVGAPALTTAGDTNTGVYFPAADVLAVATGGTERLRVGATGNVHASADGTTNPGSALGPGYVVVGNAAAASGYGFAFFKRSNVEVGTITQSGTTGVLYNTTSDYRLKENVVPVPHALVRLRSLLPSRFNFIAEPARTVEGFLAHEVAEIVPEAVTGEKDAANADGDPVHQQMDASRLVPLLVAAVQELAAEFDAYRAAHPRMTTPNPRKAA